MINRRCCGILATILALGSISLAFADDFRTWSDASGKFKIKAKFVSEADGTVTLEQEDGAELEIKLKELSAADQKAIQDLKKAAADSPFKSKGANPFTSKSKAGSKPGKNTPAAEPVGDGRAVKVNWSGAELLSSSAPGGEWKVEVGEAPEDIAKAKTIALPGKSNFFEGIKGVVFNMAAKKAVIGSIVAPPNQPKNSRLIMCDLETGRAGSSATVPGPFVPLALNDDGKQVVMCIDEFGFGKHDRLELWSVTGARVQKIVSWVPYEDKRGGERDITWAAYLDADHLATYGSGGDLAVWKMPEAEPEYHLAIPGGGVPALSPDRTLIGFCDGKNVGIFDISQKSVVALQPTPMSLHNPRLAFSPSGKRLACISQDKLLVWDVADGNQVQSMEATGIPIFTAIDFPSENCVLGGNKYLIDIENQLKLWTYDGAEQVGVAGGWTWFTVTDGQKPGALLPAKLPHPQAIELQKKAANDPSLFILRPETKVKIDVSGIPDAGQQEKARQNLTNRLAAINCQADPNGTITLTASMEGPKEVKLSYRSGDYPFQQYTSRVRFVYNNQTVWENSGTNAPGFLIRIEPGENTGSQLKKLEKPNYAFFEHVSLPKYLQKPSGGAGPSHSQTLSTSRVTVAGLR